MARRNKKHEEHENHERWLITYADLITLLLIFFVIMYSMSKIDMAKYTELSKSLAFQFKKSDTVIPQGNVGVADPGEGAEGNLSQKDPEKDSPTAEETDEVSEETEKEKQEKKAEQIEQREKELKDLKEKTEKYINDNKLQTKVSVKDTARGIAITLNDLFLFDSGKADLKPASIPILEKLSSLFPTLHAPVSIEGHTDDQPLSTGSLYQDNDGLSSERSLSVKRIFNKIPALHGKLVGAFYGDSHPIAPNDTPENRQKNRRVEIIVLREIEAEITPTAKVAP
ncbi:flagellar motor protein [Paenibacillus psychroresistens]|uniref:Flagellar motor protein n=1 Tax=Paenibacillus psychroresistens TaxID=1778678 RepID=A0A6B8RCG9_9BACL|nr:flagellar motor protein MotB [Paenibacillus psychroresistens]QGQ93554.1 flagellar motor protein [Paenibacillus psychroresistens]